jgi:hypothetical protein
MLYWSVLDSVRDFFLYHFLSGLVSDDFHSV